MSTQLSTRGRHEGDFVEYLQRLASQKDMAGRAGSEARAGLAALRRGLGKEGGEAPEMYRYIVPWTQGVTPARESAYYLVAALFASHGLSWPAAGDEDELRHTNLGASLARLATETRSDVAGHDIFPGRGLFWSS